MKNEEVKGMSNKELVTAYREERTRYQKMKFQNTVSQIEQPHKLSITRKNIARMLTELNNRRIQAELAAYMKKNNGENN
ncbi:MAG: 50S ribosomal protein L29 [Bacteroidetes bacterium]|jgi:ribosomal protein L29|nr:50S ribosomal protein L29 [Bacteroidota bacterium]